MDFSDHNLTIGGVVLAVVVPFIVEPVRNWYGARSQRRAQRRVDALTHRLREIGDYSRSPWRLQAHLLYSMLQALLFLTQAFFLLFISTQLNSDNTHWLSLPLFGFGSLGCAFGWFVASDASRTAMNVLYPSTQIPEIIHAIEKLRRRYSSLHVMYPNSPEVQEAVAQLHAERPV